MPPYARVWTRRNRFEQLDMGGATSYPAKRKVAADFLERLEAWYAGRLRDEFGRLERSKPTLNPLWHTKQGVSILQYSFATRPAEGPFYVEVEPSLARAWWRENGHEAPESGRLLPKIPSFEEVERLLTVTNQYYRHIETMNLIKYSYYFEYEDQVYAWFSRMADAVRAVRSHVGCTQGWIDRFDHGLKSVVEAFDLIATDWGWERLVAPEPARSEYHDERLAQFEETIARPWYEAAISWVRNFKGDEGVVDPLRIAEEGVARGYEATIPANRAEAAFKAADETYRSTWRLGKKAPKVANPHYSLLLDGYTRIVAAFQHAEQEVYSPALQALEGPIPRESPGPGEQTPRVETGGVERSRNPLSEVSQDSQAVALAHDMLQQGRRLNVAEVARQLGIERSRLYDVDKFPSFNALWRKHREEQKKRKPDLLRGRKSSETGDLEVWSDVKGE